MYTVVVTGGIVVVAGGAVVVIVEVIVRELLAKYPATPARVINKIRATTSTVRPIADNLDFTIFHSSLICVTTSAILTIPRSVSCDATTPSIVIT